MNYELTFTPINCTYHVHARDCRASLTTKIQINLELIFDTMASAKGYAQNDEFEKSGAKAKIKICKCAKESL